MQNTVQAFPSQSVIDAIQAIPVGTVHGITAAERDNHDYSTVDSVLECLGPGDHHVDIMKLSDDQIEALREANRTSDATNIHLYHSQRENDAAMAQMLAEVVFDPHQTVRPAVVDFIRRSLQSGIIAEGIVDNSPVNQSTLPRLGVNNMPSVIQSSFWKWVDNIQCEFPDSLDAALKTQGITPDDYEVPLVKRIDINSQQALIIKAHQMRNDTIIKLLYSFFYGAAFYYLHDGPHAVGNETRLLALQVLRTHFPQNFGSPAG